MKNLLEKIKARLQPAPRQQEEGQPERPAAKRPVNIRQLLPKVLMVVFAATFCFSAIQIIRNTLQADKRDELYQDLANVAVKPAPPKPEETAATRTLPTAPKPQTPPQ